MKNKDDEIIYLSDSPYEIFELLDKGFLLVPRDWFKHSMVNGRKDIMRYVIRKAASEFDDEISDTLVKKLDKILN